MCYTVPLAGACITTIAWARTKSVKAWWLMLLFCGGALFGVIDHAWNGELFLVSENLVSDLMLGVVITAGILAVWAGMVVLTKKNPTLARYADLSA